MDMIRHHNECVEQVAVAIKMQQGIFYQDSACFRSENAFAISGIKPVLHPFFEESTIFFVE